MPIDPEKGLHIGTLLSCLLCIIGQAVVASLILPSLPFLVKMYFPGVQFYGCNNQIRSTLATLVTIQDICFPPIIWDKFQDVYFGDGSRIDLAENALWYGWTAVFCIFIEWNLVNVISVLAFGFSNNYWVGILTRFLYGLSDGTMNVSKTMLAELANSRNISLSTSFVFVGSAIGRIIGPLCSSYLTDKKVIAPLIRKFPILEKVRTRLLYSFRNRSYCPSY